MVDLGEMEGAAQVTCATLLCLESNEQRTLTAAGISMSF